MEQIQSTKVGFITQVEFDGFADCLQDDIQSAESKNLILASHKYGFIYVALESSILLFQTQNLEAFFGFEGLQSLTQLESNTIVSDCPSICDLRLSPTERFISVACKDFIDIYYVLTHQNKVVMHYT